MGTKGCQLTQGYLGYFRLTINTLFACCSVIFNQPTVFWCSGKREFGTQSYEAVS